MIITSQFKGIPIVPKDITFPEIGELRGDFGKEVLAEYNGRVKKDYGDAEALKVLRYSDNVVKGSNPFATVLVNSILPSGLRTSTPADLERALQAGVDLKGTYTDSALVLRSENTSNAYLAKSLADQLRLRGEQKYPVMIPLTELDLVKDGCYDWDLTFKLKDNAQVIHAPILDKSGNFSNEDVDLNTGLPKKLENGNRILYTRESDLSWLCLLGGLGLGSGDDLAYSLEIGRVRVVKTL